MKTLIAVLFCLLISTSAWAASDDFGREDSSGLGGNWTLPGTLASPQIYQSVAYGEHSGLESAAYYNAFTPTDDQGTQFTLTPWASGGRVWGIVRQDTGADNSYICFAIYDGSEVFITELAGGSWNDISGDNAGLNASDVLKCEVVGSAPGTITFKQNDISVVDATDDTLTSGRLGFGLVGNYESLAGIDDWVGYNIGGAPPAATRHRITVTQ